MADEGEPKSDFLDSISANATSWLKNLGQLTYLTELL